MAGRPKTRARREAAAAPGDIPDALTAPGPNARTRARTREAPALHVRPGGVGPGVRSAADSAAAGQLAGLAQALRPGALVRIERVRPSWAAGWIEDLTLDLGGLGELYEHLQEEWGGRSYRVTVMLPNGAPGFESRIEIAGPPLDEGTVIDRDEWNGNPGKREREAREARERIPNARSSSSDTGGGLDALAWVKLLLDTQEKAAERTEKAISQLVTTSAAQNQDLIDAMLQARTAERGPNLVQQLGELEQAKRALDRMGRVFGAADRSADGAGDDGLMSGALREATKQFVGNVMASQFAGSMGPAQRPAAPAAPPGRAPAPAARPRPVPQQPPSQVRQRPTRPHSSGIPDALVSGQRRAG